MAIRLLSDLLELVKDLDPDTEISIDVTSDDTYRVIDNVDIVTNYTKEDNKKSGFKAEKKIVLYATYD